MISTKDRAKLRGLAQKLEPIVLVGKAGLTDEVLSSIDGVLSKREIVKIKLLQNCDLTTNEVMTEVCQKLSAEPVQQIGKVVVAYRFSTKKDVKHILWLHIFWLQI